MSVCCFSTFRRSLRLIPALALLLTLVHSPAPRAYAASFVVNNGGDVVDAAPGNGVCATAAGVCTLRAAIGEANALGGAHTISIDASVTSIELALNGADEDNNASGDLDIRSSLTIRGAAADSGSTPSIIDANSRDRVVHVLQGSVTLEGIRLTGGQTSGASSSVDGGGLAIEAGSSVTIRRSVLNNNFASSGGGIANRGTLVLDGVTLNNNTATIGNGGGLAQISGAGATLTNLTISNNRAFGNGGGLAHSGGGLSLSSVTVTANTADSDGDGTGDGGGLFAGSGASLSLANSILAANLDESSTRYPDCLLNGASINSQGYNLLGDNTGCAFTAAGGDQIGSASQPIDPRLGVLAANGGPTSTHAVRVNSPALDSGNPAGCGSTDQRGVARPQDGDGDSQAQCDIGAYETQIIGRFSVDSSADLADSSTGDSACKTSANTCTLRAAIEQANSQVGVDVISLPAGTYTLSRASGGVDNAGINDLDVISDVILVGAGPALTIVDGGAIDRVFEISENGSAEISGLTIQNGSTTGLGGGVLVQSGGSLALRNSNVSGNNASFGGGISVDGSLIAENVRITGNQASESGGGIYLSANQSSSSAELTAVSLSNNSAGAAGGGIAMSITLDNSRLTINQSTLNGNSATGFGGGLSVSVLGPLRAIVTLSNVTINANTANEHGGGIGVFSDQDGNAQISLNNTTLNANQADQNADDNGDGGGIYAEKSNGASVASLSIANSILAGNRDLSAGGGAVTPECTLVGGATLSSAGYNLLGSNANCAFSSATGDQVGSLAAPLDPLLGPLQNNGGNSATQRPQNGSPAIDSANPATPGSAGACASIDQRGISRPQQGSSSGALRCDIGAVEVISEQKIYLPLTRR